MENGHASPPLCNGIGGHDDASVNGCNFWKSQEDVVISGVSGRFPESGSMDEFRDNMNNGVDMVTEDDRRWEPGE